MPIHDWARVPAGLFHHFHQHWACALCDALNRGRLAHGYSALIESDAIEAVSGQASEEESYAARANRFAIHRPLGHVVAVIQIVSPGNKNSRHVLRAFVDKTLDLLQRGVHLLIVDLFPPSLRDPQGIHKAIWDEIQEEAIEGRSSRPAQPTTTTGSPSTSIRGLIPNPGARGAAIRPSTRRGAPSAVLTVT